jgi:hypothetical protein
VAGAGVSNTVQAAPELAGAAAPPVMAKRSSGFNLLRLAPLGGIIAAAVIGFAIVGSLNVGGPIHASDGSFSVKNPGGWYPTTWSLFQGYPVVLSIQSEKGGAKSDFAVIDPGRQVPLDAIPAEWEQLQASGQLPSTVTLGGTTQLSVGGAPAIAGDLGGVLDGTEFEGRIVFINYNNRTYLLAMASNRQTYTSMLNDFDSLLSSWTWLH